MWGLQGISFHSVEVLSCFRVLISKFEGLEAVLGSKLRMRSCLQLLTDSIFTTIISSLLCDISVALAYSKNLPSSHFSLREIHTLSLEWLFWRESSMDWKNYSRSPRQTASGPDWFHQRVLNYVSPIPWPLSWIDQHPWVCCRTEFSLVWKVGSSLLLKDICVCSRWFSLSTLSWPTSIHSLIWG